MFLTIKGGGKVKKITINGCQVYFSEKIIKQNNNIKLINAIDTEGNNLGDLLFPNISNMDEFQLEEGQEWDVEVDENKQRIADLELAIAEILGGGL